MFGFVVLCFQNQCSSAFKFVLKSCYLGLVWFKKNGHSSLSFHHPSLSFHHSSLITHHLKHPTLFGTITYLSSLNIFQLFVGPILVPCVAFTFFFFFLQPSVAKFTEPSEKKKIIKIKNQTHLTQEKKKKDELKTKQ